MQLSTISLYLKHIQTKQKKAAHAIARGSQRSLLVTSQGGQQNLYWAAKSLRYDYTFKDTETKPKQGVLFHICYKKVGVEIMPGEGSLGGLVIF